MIVKTRYRDIAFEEAVKCTPQLNTLDMADVWIQSQGQTIEIETPCLPDKSPFSFFVCGGPFYKVVGVPLPYVVCPHIAEIGD